MGKTRDDPGQQRFDFEASHGKSSLTWRANHALERLDALYGNDLIAVLVENGIFHSADEVEQEYRMSIDPRSDDFGGIYTFAEYLRDGKNDWKRMLAMIAEGTVADGAAAREAMYEGRDNISRLRRNRIMCETRRQTRDTIRWPGQPR